MHTPVDSTESITVCGILVRLSPQQHLGTLTVVPLGCQHKHWLVVSLEQEEGRGREKAVRKRVDEMDQEGGRYSIKRTVEEDRGGEGGGGGKDS